MKNLQPEVQEFQNLLRDTVASNTEVRENARETLASLYSSSLSRVLEPTAVANKIFTETLRYTDNDIPEIPIDTYFGIGEGAFDLWSNGYPGGLQYNEITGEDTFRFRPYRIDSAIAWNIDYARSARLDVVNKGMNRLLAEVMVKSQFKAFSVIAEGLAKARNNGLGHVIPSFAKESNAGHRFQIEDINRLKTRMKRLNPSWALGSTMGGGTLTDLFVSPEIVGDIRRMSYNPMNTTVVPGNATTATAMPLPDGVREDIFRDPNTTSLWNIRIHEMSEFGVGQPYNLLFSDWYTRFGTAGAAGAPTWNLMTDEIVLGIDATMGAFVRAVQADGDGNTFQMEVDDQHLKRSKKMGYYGFLEEAYLFGNNKAAIAMIV